MAKRNLYRVVYDDTDRAAEGADPIEVPATLEIAVALPGTQPATAANYGTFFHANRAWQIRAVRISQAVAGTDAGAVTLTVEKLTGVQALDAGVSVLTGTHNLKGAIDTVEKMTLTATAADLLLAAGDRLALKDAGVLTTVGGVCATVTLGPV